MKLPKTAAALQVKAEAAGWTVEILEPTILLTILRMRRRGRTVTAAWRAGAFAGGAVLVRVTEGNRVLTPLPHRISAKHLNEVIAS